MAVPEIWNNMFLQARSKLQRANGHVQELNAGFQHFLQTDFCKLHVEKDPNTGDQTVRFDSIAELPPYVPCVIGDTAHNIRTAFDYVTSHAVGAGTRISFPVSDTRANLQQKGRAWDTLKKSSGILPALADHILDTVQPYKGGKFKVWEITQLDNADKHALLTPVTSIYALNDVRLVDEKNNNTITVGQVQVGEGGHLNIVRSSPGLDFKIQPHGKPSAAILFPKGNIFEGQDVIQTLGGCIHLAFEVIQSLELLFFGKIPDPNARR